MQNNFNSEKLLHRRRDLIAIKRPATALLAIYDARLVACFSNSSGLSSRYVYWLTSTASLAREWWLPSVRFDELMASFAFASREHTDTQLQKIGSWRIARKNWIALCRIVAHACQSFRNSWQSFVESSWPSFEHVRSNFCEGYFAEIIRIVPRSYPNIHLIALVAWTIRNDFIVGNNRWQLVLKFLRLVLLVIMLLLAQV